MRRDKWNELRMLRELVWLTIGANNVKCWFGFCNRPLLDATGLTFGHHHHSPITDPITIHHIDFNRDNNSPTNLALCHRECHKRFHKQLAYQQAKGGS